MAVIALGITVHVHTHMIMIIMNSSAQQRPDIMMPNEKTIRTVRC